MEFLSPQIGIRRWFWELLLLAQIGYRAPESEDYSLWGNWPSHGRELGIMEAVAGYTEIFALKSLKMKAEL